MRVGPDGLPKAWAAESYDLEGRQTVDGQAARTGMKWHDGKPVTPEDVKFSFEALVSGEAPMYKPFGTQHRNAIEIDGHGHHLRLKKPAASFVTSSLPRSTSYPSISG